MRKFKRALHKLAYQENGEFSLTRLVMASLSFWATMLIFMGLVVYLVPQIFGFSGIILPDNLYDYTFKLAGGGILQYGFTKAVGAWGRKGDGETPPHPDPEEEDGKGGNQE